MTDRSDRIRLPAHESRCSPSRPCKLKSRCARVQATIPKGAPLEDFTTGSDHREQWGGTVLCSGYYPLATVHVDAYIKPVKQPLRGI